MLCFLFQNSPFQFIPFPLCFHEVIHSFLSLINLGILSLNCSSHTIDIPIWSSVTPVPSLPKSTWMSSPIWVKTPLQSFKKQTRECVVQQAAWYKPLWRFWLQPVLTLHERSSSNPLLLFFLLLLLC